VKFNDVWQTTNRTSIMNPKWSSAARIYILYTMQAFIQPFMLCDSDTLIWYSLFCCNFIKNQNGVLPWLCSWIEPKHQEHML
jgi:CTP:phosphocholine cytidylyltransferase-like protein